MVEVIAEGENAAIALDGCFGERRLAAPGLNYDVLRQIRAQDFVPSHHLLSMLLQDGLDALIEVRLQVVSARETVGSGELLDLRIGVPLVVQNLVAANVEELV